MKKVELFFLALILMLGTGLRSVEVLNKNYLFGFDQGRDYLAVRKIAVEKKLTLIGPEVGAGMAGFSGIFHGPYYYYSLVVPFILFDGDPYGGMLLMFFFGVASLVLCFYIAQKITGTKSALMATFLLSISPVISSQSRFIWNSHPTTFFILLAFWFTTRIEKNPFKFFFLATFFAGIIYGFELAISVPLLVAQFVYVWLVLKKRNFKTFLAGAFGVVLAYLPFFAFELRHGFMAVKSVIGLFSKIVSGQANHNYQLQLEMNLSSFWLNFKNTFLIGNKWFAFLLLALMIVCLFLVMKKMKINTQKNFLSFLLILPLVSFAVFLLLNNIVWDYYLIHLHLAYIFLLSVAVVKTRLKLAKAIFWLLIILMLPGVFRETKRAYEDYFDDGGTAKIKGKVEALDYIYQDTRGEKFNVLVFTPPVYDYAYRYLLAWYGAKKYGWVPGDEKKGLVYLWIEPDPSGIWHKGWLETVVKTGEVLEETTLPNGFLIQKRFYELKGEI